MNEERQMILEMLKEGKISVEEASGLLEALGKNNSNKNEDSFVNKLSNSFEKVLKKTTDTISNIDFEAMKNIDFDSMKKTGNVYHINSVTVDKQTKINDEIKEIEIDLVNGSVELEKYQDDGILIDESVSFKDKGQETNDYLVVECEDDKLKISTNPKYSKLQVVTNVKISLDKNVYDKLNINMVNGEIEVEDVDFLDCNVESVNGRVLVMNSTSDLDVKNTNGKIEIKNVNGAIDVNNVNGPINLSNIKGSVANLNAINGSMRLDGMKSEKIVANSKSGSIKLQGIEDSKSIVLNSAFGSIYVDTEGYIGDILAVIKGSNHSTGDKFENKLQKEEGYEVSTNLEKADLRIDLKSGFGKVSIK